ncbi:DUF2357 domain-containing protein [Rubrivirga sp. IMCC45206]|uniref:DUF2357 domain-containing protein n=1 Tax=Rubrivirga sp. IMCC45206 TaxID=3391614 RepID=UPI00398FA463
MQTLFTLETPDVRLTWSGPGGARAGVEPLRVEAGADRLVVAPEAAVWLAEETAYPVLVQSLRGAPVSLAHRDPVVTGGLVSADGGRVLHGRVRFGSQAGRARFEIQVGNRVEVAFSVSVLPTKLEETEVTRMRAEVEAAAAGLSVAAIRPTTRGVDAGPAAPSVPVWLAALRQSVADLTRAVRAIDRRPALDLIETVENMRPGQILRPSAETRAAVRRCGLDVDGLPAGVARFTVDTPSHRWLAGRVAGVVRELRALERAEALRRPSLRRGVLRAEVGTLAQQLESLAKVPVLAPAGARAPSVPPLVLRRRPAYAAAFDALRRLDHGLALRKGALDVAMQDLAVLYETWAALAVVRSVAGALGVGPPARPFGIDVRGADVRLRRGRAHAVRLKGDGVAVEIVNTPRFPAPPALLAQRPDLLLTVRRDGEVRRVVLDAKYRRDDSAEYRRRHGASGPPEDALGTLHRYRDAIPGEVALAAALFPGTPDGPFYGSRLWTSLDTLGVGAVPLRPGATDALDRLITGFVG